MSHITKILLKILMARMRNKITPEIAEEQCGFVKDKGTRNAIYMIRTLTERAIEIQKDLYLCFIDYIKAVDKLRHEEIMSILDSLNIYGKDLRIVRNIYWEQTAAMRIGNDLSAFQDIKRGVRQGCVLSPDLFSIYSEIIMRALEGMPGIKVGGYNMNNIRYADDTVLIADNEKELQEMLDTVVRESEKKGLSLNKKKTEVMVISKKNCTPACNIVMNGTVLKQVHKFNYLGSLITSDGRCIDEIKRRMAQAKASFQNMKSILTNKRMSLGVRKRILQCYIEPILLCGCESWSMTKQTLTSIEAMEMWFLRRMLRVSCTEKRTNLEILNWFSAGSTRKLISNVKRRQAAFLGHVMRKGKLEHLLTTGKIEGKRSRGRQRIKIQDDIAAWLGRSTAEMFVDARDREWKVMIAYACNRHGN